MKTKLSFVCGLCALLWATSCNVERSDKYQALLAERDSLYTEAIAAKGGFDEALNTINEIENALESVRAQENIIMMENQEGNTNQAVSEINAIQQTLQENRQKIENLAHQVGQQVNKIEWHSIVQMAAPRTVGNDGHFVAFTILEEMWA